MEDFFVAQPLWGGCFAGDSRLGERMDKSLSWVVSNRGGKQHDLRV